MPNGRRYRGLAFGICLYIPPPPPPPPPPHTHTHTHTHTHYSPMSPFWPLCGIIPPPPPHPTHTHTHTHTTHQCPPSGLSVVLYPPPPHPTHTHTHTTHQCPPSGLSVVLYPPPPPPPPPHTHSPMSPSWPLCGIVPPTLTNVPLLASPWYCNVTFGICLYVLESGAPYSYDVSEEHTGYWQGEDKPSTRTPLHPLQLCQGVLSFIIHILCDSFTKKKSQAPFTLEF